MIKKAISWVRNWLNSSEFKTQIIKGSGISLFIQFGFAALSFVSASLLARFLGANGYGEYSNAQSWVSVLAPIATLGFNFLIVRNVAVYNSQQKWGELKGLNRFSTGVVLGISTILITIVTGLSFLIFNHAEDLGLREALNITALLIPLVALSSLLQSEMRSFSHVARALFPDLIFRPLFIVASILSLYYFAPQFLNSRSASFVAVLSSMVSVVIAGLWLRKIIPPPALNATPIYQNKEWIKTALPLMLMQVFNLLLIQASPILLGIQKSSTDVGLFSAAFRVAYLVNFFQAAISFVIAPMLAQMYANKEYTKIQYTLRWSVWLTFIACLLVTFVFIFGASLLLNLFGSEFVQAKNALIILLIGNLIGVATGQSTALLNMCGYQKQSAIIYIVTSLATVGLNLVMIPTWGYIGAALASSIGVVINQLALAIYVRKKMDLNPAIF